MLLRGWSIHHRRIGLIGLAVWAALVVIPSGPVQAQAPDPIAYGDIVTGTLTEEMPFALYTFMAQADDVLNITAITGEGSGFDLVLELFDPSGAMIAFSADYAGPHPAIRQPKLLRSGTYELVVQAISGQGAFTLRLEGQPASGVILFEDDFDDNTADWETVDDEDVLSGFGDGVYVIEYKPPQPFCSDCGWLVAPGFSDWDLAPQLAPPYDMQIEIGNVQDAAENYRLVLMFHVQADYADYYAFSIRRNGEWTLESGREEAFVADVVEPIPFQDGATHTLGVRVGTDVYTFWVDDRLITQVAVQEIAGLLGERQLHDGSIGFGVGIYYLRDGIFVRAEFDNLVVRAVE
jgi:hypothetical protein